ncbi:hypothetical protein [Paraburkholderia sp. J8-2]|uniref:hypothetical protein n=1 Tax=Paraburkholderia sp. J8-2 TaxID=2805440 RepID=UPI002AB66AE4|nr:hypothetical protein [Paraburkholderia sp. J8-2]
MQPSLLLKPVSKALIAAFAREGVRVGPSTGPDLIVSTYGFWTAQLAFEYATPFIIAPAPKLTRETPAHMHLKWTIERIKGIAKVDDWKAQQLAAITNDVVRESGLSIDMQAVVFDQRLATTRERILKALRDPDFPPVHASVAIGAGLLPEAMSSLDAHLAQMGPERALGPGGHGTIAEVVARDATYLWQRPPRELREFESAFVDWVHMRDNKPFSAEIGLGFCLLQPYVSAGRRQLPNYSVFSPILHYREGSQWRMSGIPSTSYREAEPFTRGQRPLAEVIGAPVTTLQRAAVCPACMDVFAPASANAPHRCPDGGPHARHLVDTLRARYDSGSTTFTASELNKDSRPRPGSQDGVVAVQALEQFLLTHRATLGLRAFNGTWALMRRPTIMLTAGASPASPLEGA